MCLDDECVVTFHGNVLFDTFSASNCRLYFYNSIFSFATSDSIDFPVLDVSNSTLIFVSSFITNHDIILIWLNVHCHLYDESSLIVSPVSCFSSDIFIFVQGNSNLRIGSNLLNIDFLVISDDSRVTVSSVDNEVAEIDTLIMQNGVLTLECCALVDNLVMFDGRISTNDPVFSNLSASTVSLLGSHGFNHLKINIPFFVLSSCYYIPPSSCSGHDFDFSNVFLMNTANITVISQDNSLIAFGGAIGSIVLQNSIAFLDNMICRDCQFDCSMCLDDECVVTFHGNVLFDTFSASNCRLYFYNSIFSNTNSSRQEIMQSSLISHWKSSLFPWVKSYSSTVFCLSLYNTHFHLYESSFLELYLLDDCFDHVSLFLDGNSSAFVSSSQLFLDEVVVSDDSRLQLQSLATTLSEIGALVIQGGSSLFVGSISVDVLILFDGIIESVNSNLTVQSVSMQIGGWSLTSFFISCPIFVFSHLYYRMHVPVDSSLLGLEKVTLMNSSISTVLASHDILFYRDFFAGCHGLIEIKMMNSAKVIMSDLDFFSFNALVFSGSFHLHNISSQHYSISCSLVINSHWLLNNLLSSAFDIEISSSFISSSLSINSCSVSTLPLSNITVSSSSTNISHSFLSLNLSSVSFHTVNVFLFKSKWLLHSSTFVVDNLDTIIVQTTLETYFSLFNITTIRLISELVEVHLVRSSSLGLKRLTSSSTKSLKVFGKDNSSMFVSSCINFTVCSVIFRDSRLELHQSHNIRFKILHLIESLFFIDGDASVDTLYWDLSFIYGVDCRRPFDYIYSFAPSVLVIQHSFAFGTFFTTFLYQIDLYLMFDVTFSDADLFLNCSSLRFGRGLYINPLTSFSLTSVNGAVIFEDSCFVESRQLTMVQINCSMVLDHHASFEVYGLVSFTFNSSLLLLNDYSVFVINSNATVNHLSVCSFHSFPFSLFELQSGTCLHGSFENSVVSGDFTVSSLFADLYFTTIFLNNGSIETVRVFEVVSFFFYSGTVSFSTGDSDRLLTLTPSELYLASTSYRTLNFILLSTGYLLGSGGTLRLYHSKLIVSGLFHILQTDFNVTFSSSDASSSILISNEMYVESTGSVVFDCYVELFSLSFVVEGQVFVLSGGRVNECVSFLNDYGKLVLIDVSIFAFSMILDHSSCIEASSILLVESYVSSVNQAHVSILNGTFFNSMLEFGSNSSGVLTADVRDCEVFFSDFASFHLSTIFTSSSVFIFDSVDLLFGSSFFNHSLLFAQGQYMIRSAGSNLFINDSEIHLLDLQCPYCQLSFIIHNSVGLIQYSLPANLSCTFSIYSSNMSLRSASHGVFSSLLISGSNINASGNATLLLSEVTSSVLCSDGHHLLLSERFIMGDCSLYLLFTELVNFGYVEITGFGSVLVSGISSVFRVSGQVVLRKMFEQVVIDCSTIFESAGSLVSYNDVIFDNHSTISSLHPFDHPLVFVSSTLLFHGKWLDSQLVWSSGSLVHSGPAVLFFKETFVFGGTVVFSELTANSSVHLSILKVDSAAVKLEHIIYISLDTVFLINGLFLINNNIESLDIGGLVCHNSTLKFSDFSSKSTHLFFYFDPDFYNCIVFFNTGQVVVFRSLRNSLSTAFYGDDEIIDVQALKVSTVFPSCCSTSSCTLFFTGSEFVAIFEYLFLEVSFGNLFFLDHSLNGVVMIIYDCHSSPFSPSVLLVSFSFPKFDFYSVFSFPLCLPQISFVEQVPTIGGHFSIFGDYFGHQSVMISVRDQDYILFAVNHTKITAFIDEGDGCHLLTVTRMFDMQIVTCQICFEPPFVNSTSPTPFPLFGDLFLVGYNFGVTFPILLVNKKIHTFVVSNHDHHSLELLLDPLCEVSSSTIVLQLIINQQVSNSFQVNLGTPPLTIYPTMIPSSGGLLLLSQINYPLLLDPLCNPNISFSSLFNISIDNIHHPTGYQLVTIGSCENFPFVPIELSLLPGVSNIFEVPISDLYIRVEDLVCFVHHNCHLIVYSKLDFDFSHFRPQCDEFSSIIDFSIATDVVHVTVRSSFSHFLTLYLCDSYNCISCHGGPPFVLLSDIQPNFIQLFSTSLPHLIKVTGTFLSFYSRSIWMNSIHFNRTSCTMDELSESSLSMFVTFFGEGQFELQLVTRSTTLPSGLFVSIDHFLKVCPFIPQFSTIVVYLFAPLVDLSILFNTRQQKLVEGSNLVQFSNPMPPALLFNSFNVSYNRSITFVSFVLDFDLIIETDSLVTINLPLFLPLSNTLMFCEPFCDVEIDSVNYVLFLRSHAHGPFALVIEQDCNFSSWSKSIEGFSVTRPTFQLLSKPYMTQFDNIGSILMTHSIDCVAFELSISDCHMAYNFIVVHSGLLSCKLLIDFEVSHCFFPVSQFEIVWSSRGFLNHSISQFTFFNISTIITTTRLNPYSPQPLIFDIFNTYSAPFLKLATEYGLQVQLMDAVIFCLTNGYSIECPDVTTPVVRPYVNVSMFLKQTLLFQYSIEVETVFEPFCYVTSSLMLIDLPLPYEFVSLSDKFRCCDMSLSCGYYFSIRNELVSLELGTNHLVTSVAISLDLPCDSSAPFDEWSLLVDTFYCTQFANGFTLSTHCTYTFVPEIASIVSFSIAVPTRIFEIEVYGYDVSKCFEPVDDDVGVSISNYLVNISTVVWVYSFEIPFPSLLSATYFIRSQSNFQPADYVFTVVSTDCYTVSASKQLFVGHGYPVNAVVSNTVASDHSALVVFTCFDEFFNVVDCDQVTIINSTLNFEDYYSHHNSIELFSPSMIYGLHLICFDFNYKFIVCEHITLTQRPGGSLLIMKSLVELCPLHNHFDKVCFKTYLNVTFTEFLSFSNSSSILALNNLTFDFDPSIDFVIEHCFLTIVSPPLINLSLIIHYGSFSASLSFLSSSCPPSKDFSSSNRCICPPGFEMSSLGHCEICPPNSYSLDQKCVECPFPLITTTSGNDDISACLCPDQFALSSTGHCLLCPRALKCRKGLVVDSPVGILANISSSIEIRHCPIRSFCVNNTCVVGRSGLFCLYCSEQESHPLLSCSRTPSFVSFVLVLSAFTLFCILFDHIFCFPLFKINQDLFKQFSGDSYYCRTSLSYLKRYPLVYPLVLLSFVSIIYQHSVFSFFYPFNQFFSFFLHSSVTAVLLIILVVFCVHRFYFLHPCSLSKLSISLPLCSVIIAADFYQILIMLYYSVIDFNVSVITFVVLELLIMVILCCFTFFSFHFTDTIISMVLIFSEFLPLLLWLCLACSCFLVTLIKQNNLRVFVVFVIIVVLLFKISHSM
ncbi:hypothetical protein RCL1_005513 [Eukaryota sp. TZLM3-RCL]